MRVVTVEEMRRIESEAAARDIPSSALMENAGRACAAEILRTVPVRPARVVVLVGPGNNGGDALVAAHHLAQAGISVEVVCATAHREDDPNLQRVHNDLIPVATVYEHTSDIELERLLHADVVVDGLLGTGRSRPLEGALRRIAAHLSERRPGRKVFAIDLPTGLDADSGHLDPAAVRADVTMALGFPKTGHLIHPGAEAVGELRVIDIGLPASLREAASTELLDATWATGLLPPRPRDAHKGTFGRLLIIGGCAQYYGAPVIAATSALRSGVGLATIAAPAPIIPMLAVKLTEATLLPLPEQEGFVSAEAVDVLRDVASRTNGIVLGPGIGLSPTTRAVVPWLIAGLPAAVPLLVDADALTILSETPEWWTHRPEQVILTPHAGEMGRLLGLDAATVQADRLRYAREAARRWGVTVVLKGAGTLVATPSGQVRVSIVATPALATAGTGDCLAGTIGALLAQGLSAFDAAALGIFVHGEAGLLAEQEIGLSGTMAGDIVDRLPRVFQSLRSAREARP